MFINIEQFVFAYNQAMSEISELEKAINDTTHAGLAIAPRPQIITMAQVGRKYFALMTDRSTKDMTAFVSPFGGGGLVGLTILIEKLEKSLATAIANSKIMSWKEFVQLYVPKALTNVLDLHSEDVLYLNADPKNPFQFYNQAEVLEKTGFTQDKLWDIVKYTEEFIWSEVAKARKETPVPIRLREPEFVTGTYTTPWPYDDTTPLRGTERSMIFKPLNM